MASTSWPFRLLTKVTLVQGGLCSSWRDAKDANAYQHEQRCGVSVSEQPDRLQWVEGLSRSRGRDYGHTVAVRDRPVTRFYVRE